MKRILTVITMAILTLTAIGTAEARQQTDSRNSLAGKVSDAATSAPIEFATVALILPDSTFVDGTTTDSTGKFAFSGLTAREYILKISFIGYKGRGSSESIRPTAQTSGQSASNLTLRCWML